MSISVEEKMKVEIWSDVVCPFCYIGKRKFEKALSDFKYKDKIEVHWRSYQLDPNAESQSNENAYAYLARLKGQSLDWSVKMHNHVTKLAAEAGLDYHFEKAKISNSQKAHLLIQLARSKGVDAELKELLFRAYFTEGKNIGDEQTLVEIALKSGLNHKEALEAVSTDKYNPSLRNDILEGEQLGLSGVPFFVFDKRIAVSGAQDPKVFLDALEKSYLQFVSEKGKK